MKKLKDPQPMNTLPKTGYVFVEGEYFGIVYGGPFCESFNVETIRSLQDSPLHTYHNWSKDIYES